MLHWHAPTNRALERTEIRELSDTGCADARFLADSLLKATLDTLPIGIVVVDADFAHRSFEFNCGQNARRR